MGKLEKSGMKSKQGISGRKPRVRYHRDGSVTVSSDPSRIVALWEAAEGHLMSTRW